MEPVVLLVVRPWDGLGVDCQPGDRLVLWHAPAEGIILQRVCRPDYGAVLAAVNAGALTPAAVAIDARRRTTWRE